MRTRPINGPVKAAQFSALAAEEQSVRVPGVVVEACAHQKSCTVYSPSLGLEFGGSFSEVDQRKVLVRLEPGVKEQQVPIQALCAVFFDFRASGYTFLSVVKSVSVGADGIVLISLLVPTSIAEYAFRRTPRYPVLQSSRLSASIEIEGQKLPLVIIDIGLGGIQVELPPGVQLPTGQAVIPLTLRDPFGTVTQSTQVRWHRENRVGLFFTRKMVDGRPEPATDLTSLVSRVAAQWSRPTPSIAA